MMKPLLDDYDLGWCNNFDLSNIEYTYFQDSLGRYSLIDHMFISCSLLCNVIQYCTVDSGLNFSDHVPIRCVIAFPFSSNLQGMNHMGTRKEHKNKTCKVLRWDKEDLQLYYDYTGQMLQDLYIPYGLLCCKCDSTPCCHRDDINKFYHQIINSLHLAASRCVPVVHCNSSKPYLSAELQQLKVDSMQAHLAWEAVGKPTAC